MKQFIVRSLLGFLRGLIFLKRHGNGWFQKLAAPFKSVSLFFIRAVGIPGYRALFFVRRYIQKILLPAKHRLVYLISNRYTMHVMMVLIVAGVTWVNLSARDVRAEDFGQKSLLYQLVSEDDSSVLEVVEAGSPVGTLGTSSSYLSGTVVDARRHIDLDFLEETATPTVGEVTPKETVEVPVRSGIETYAVQEGDTLGRIAESYGLSLSTILWSNGLTYTSTIQPGQELKILPVDGVLYTVRNGDTLSRIARNYSVDVEMIMSQNGLASANRLAIGDELLLPGGEPPSPVSTTRSSASITNLFTAPSISAPSGAVGGWVWPTNWHTITQYYGWRHTGVDIDGDYTTSSYAARGGVVIYSGWRSGYGLSVEIDHGDGYVTRYAHHSKNYVAVGDVVSAGQVLAQTGTTGRSTGTHLHFEVIRNGKFQNPLDYVR
ncbi:M23 family metallopeptidase [Patescibacteria group bacterium]|nr:MAG: M23 family metallopeptidase [Patescibacteria group bacterium]